MRAMVLERQREPLVERDVPEPAPGPGQVLLRVVACGVCRTDLHVLDGDLEHPKLPLVLGHQIVGEVVAGGEGADRFRPGERIGVAVARLDLRRVPLLPFGTGEPVPASAVHGI